MESRSAIASLPLIDVSPLVSASSAAERQRVGREIRRAAIDIGFFYIVGHGIPAAELDATLELGRRFFALPLTAKVKLRADRALGTQGYQPLAAGTVDEYGREADLKERFSLSRELVANEPERGRYGAGLSQWPSDSLVPGFSAFFKDHIEKRMALTRALARGFALSLDLAEDHFDAAFSLMGGVLMFNHYPRIASAPGRVSFSPHTDYGAFTILSQDSLGGLMVRNAAGDWIDVPPVVGSFVVNIGDMFAMWTNDLYVSTLHRVMNRNDSERLSLAFFTYPHGLTEIRCLPTCTDAANPPRYAPVLAEDYNRQLVDYANRYGRPGIAARTAERLAADEA